MFWLFNPTTANVNNPPIWYVGDPYSTSVTPPPLVPDNEFDEFPTGAAGGAQNGNIKITAASVGVANRLNAFVDPPNPFYENSGFVTVYAAVANALGDALQAVYETNNGGFGWTNVTGNLGQYLSTSGQYSNTIITPAAGRPVPAPRCSWAARFRMRAPRPARFSRPPPAARAGTTFPYSPALGRTARSTPCSSIPRTTCSWAATAAFSSTTPATSAWTDLNGDLAISQTTSVASDPTTSSILFATTQNEGTEEFDGATGWKTVDASGTPPPNTAPPTGIQGGGNIYIDPSNPEIIYAVQTTLESKAIVRMSINGGLTWTTIFNSTSTTIPIALDNVNSNRLLVGDGAGGGLSVFENGILTQSLVPPINVTALAIPEYQGIFTADPDFTDVGDEGSDSYDSGTIYVTNGTDISVTKDGGLTWAGGVGGDRDIPGVSGGIVQLVIDPTNRDTVYAVVNSFGDQIWESNDAGLNWYPIGVQNSTAMNFPAVPAWTLVIDPRNGTLYAGTDTGVYVLVGGSQEGQTTNNWQPFGVGLPNVQVRDLVLNQATNTLIAGTYGRGVFELFLDAPQSAPVTTLTAAGTYAPTPISAPIVVLSGNSAWTGPVDLNYAAGTTFTIALYGNPGAQDAVSTAHLNIVGVMSDTMLGSDPTVVKQGEGTLVLSGANTYGGLTDIQQGIVIVDNFQALGSTANGTIVEPGTALELESSVDQEPLTLFGDGPVVPDEIGGIITSPAGRAGPFDGHNTGAAREHRQHQHLRGPDHAGGSRRRHGRDHRRGQRQHPDHHRRHRRRRRRSDLDQGAGRHADSRRQHHVYRRHLRQSGGAADRRHRGA